MAKIFKAADDVAPDDVTSRKSKATLEFNAEDLAKIARGETVDVELDVSAALSRPLWTIEVKAVR